jgi:kumamolisin
MTTEYIPLEGSGPRSLPGLRPTSASAQAASQRIEVTLSLRRGSALPRPGAAPISREEFAERYGATEEDITKVVSFANRFGLTVDDVNRPSRQVVLSGTIRQLATAFRVEFVWLQDANGKTYRSYKDKIQIPKDLAGTLTSVLGLEDLPQAY